MHQKPLPGSDNPFPGTTLPGFSYRHASRLVPQNTEKTMLSEPESLLHSISDKQTLSERVYLAPTYGCRKSTLVQLHQFSDAAGKPNLFINRGISMIRHKSFSSLFITSVFLCGLMANSYAHEGDQVLPIPFGALLALTTGSMPAGAAKASRPCRPLRRRRCWYR